MIQRLIDLAGGPDTVQVVVVVGANDGGDSLPPAHRYPSIRFYAIEPTPALAEQLRCKSASIENYTVVECAIGLIEATQKLRLRGQSGLNSVGEIDLGEVTRAGVDPGVYDVQAHALVSVRRLKSVCAELAIDHIDVLHVDAQGSDFDVLASADDLLATIRAGVVEVPSRLKLYENSARRRDFARYLQRAGLCVVDIAANDHLNLEQNLVFARARNSSALMLNRVYYPLLAARASTRFFLWRARDGLGVRFASRREKFRSAPR